MNCKYGMDHITNFCKDAFCGYQKPEPQKSLIEMAAKNYIDLKQWAFYARELEYKRALEMYSVGHAAGKSERDAEYTDLHKSVETSKEENTRLSAELADLKKLNKCNYDSFIAAKEEITRLKDALGEAKDGLNAIQLDREKGWYNSDLAKTTLSAIDKALEGGK